MLQPNFHPFPELKTERLVLRRLRTEDKEEMFFLRSDKKVLAFLHKEPAATVKEAEDFIKRILEDMDNNDLIMWGMALAENPDLLIGTISYWRMQKEHYRAELGYVLHPDYWGKGIMKEAVLAVIDYGFNKLQLHSIEARINPANKGSVAVLESTGFTREAYFKEDFFFKGEFGDTAVYSLLQQ